MRIPHLIRQMRFPSEREDGASVRFFRSPSVMANAVGVVLAVCWCCGVGRAQERKDTPSFQRLLDEADAELTRLCNRLSEARWDYETNITEANRNDMINATMEFERQRKVVTQAIQKSEWQRVQDASMRRQFEKLARPGTSVLSDKDQEELHRTISEMLEMYSEAKICPPGAAPPCTLNLDKDLDGILSSSRDYDALAYYWTAWRNATGARLRGQFLRYVNLTNTVARLQGFPSADYLWLQDFEEDVPEFKKELEQLWAKIEPLYKLLYSYVRKRLRTTYPQIKRNSPLPAHILGNMWAQTWTNIFPLVKPYDVEFPNITRTMEKQNYDVMKMFKDAESFFVSMGLDPMTETFWNKSMLVRPNDREVVCHASASDFCLGRGSSDFRIKMCTNINYEDFRVIHHEMGHIQYFMEYRDQPFAFREGANEGFHEAIGDTVELAFSTEAHLAAAGLLEARSGAPSSGKEARINHLLLQALGKVAFLPFGYLIDRWRWEVFDGSASESELNERWWRHRYRYQGLVPPVPRTETDLDPVAKFHVAGDVPYIRYFVAHVLQFQFYEALCSAAGHAGPLSECDFFNSTAAGRKLREALAKGSSQHWRDTLEELTRSRRMTAEPLLRYFGDLSTWLKSSVSNECIGWGGDCSTDLMEVLKSYNSGYSPLESRLQKSRWNFSLDISNSTQELLSEQEKVLDDWKILQWRLIVDSIDLEHIEDQTIKRAFKMIKGDLGTSLLNGSDAKNYTMTVSSMVATYSKTRVCPFEKQNCNLGKQGLWLVPDIQNLIASSRDYRQLHFYWKVWRDVTGSRLQETFGKYLELENAVAKANDFPDARSMWLSIYGDGFAETARDLWSEVRGLYERLHAYLSRRLRERYPGLVRKRSGIPGHLLGSMWGGDWSSWYTEIRPFPDAQEADVTDSLLRKNYTMRKILEQAEDFYVSLGLPLLGKNFYDMSVVERPNQGRVVSCYPSAWDFSDGVDFRVQMCGEVDLNSFLEIHREIGHVQYQILYKDSLSVFRRAANPGFEHSVGRAISLSVANPDYLKSIDLFPSSFSWSYENEINFLMQVALRTIPLLPLSYSVDLWRWKLFNKTVSPDNMNYEWWKLRQARILHVSNDYFDLGGEYHVAAGIPCLRQFFSIIMGFQLFESLCKEAHQYDPTKNGSLHRCNLYSSKEAGHKLSEGLSIGSRDPWPRVMEMLTGEARLSTRSLLTYFSPLDSWLIREMEKDEVGWVIDIDKYFDKKIIDNTIPIIVGAILGTLVVLVIIGFVIKRIKDNKTTKELKKTASARSSVSSTGKRLKPPIS